MSGRLSTVRWRLTVTIVLVVGAVAITAALLVPQLVRTTLTDDLLDEASADTAADPLTPVGEVVSLFTDELDDDELTMLFAPEIGNLVAALDDADATDELRTLRDDGQLVIAAAPDIIAIVDDDGGVTVRRRSLQTAGPVVTSSQLESIAADLDVDWFTLGPFDAVITGDRSFLDLLDEFEFLQDDVLGLGPLEQLFSDLPLDDLPLDEIPFDELFGDGELGPLPFEDLVDALGEELPVVTSEPPAPPDTEPALPTDATEIDYAYGIRDVDGVDLIVAAPSGSVDRSVDRLTTALWISVPVAMLLVGLATWFVTSRALRPVGLITERTGSIRGGSLHERVPVPDSRDEIADLAVEMNAMLERLQADDARRRQFVSDASHELRSPIAAIQTQAEAALHTEPSDDARHLAEGVLAEAERMGLVVADLLALARHDEGLAPPGVPIDLDDIVLTEARRPRRIPVDTHAVSAGQVRGRPDEITRVVAHLLDNAARHARSTIVVTLRSEAGRVRLVVDDDGPGIPPAERQRVFERFVRLDAARERDRGGAGLGLAVVAAVVRAAGGSVTVDDSPLGGARVGVDLPAVS